MVRILPYVEGGRVPCYPSRVLLVIKHLVVLIKSVYVEHGLIRLQIKTKNPRVIWSGIYFEKEMPKSCTSIPPKTFASSTVFEPLRGPFDASAFQDWTDWVVPSDLYCAQCNLFIPASQVQLNRSVFKLPCNRGHFRHAHCHDGCRKCTCPVCGQLIETNENTQFASCFCKFHVECLRERYRVLTDSSYRVCPRHASLNQHKA